MYLKTRFPPRARAYKKAVTRCLVARPPEESSPFMRIETTATHDKDTNQRFAGLRPLQT